MQADMALLLLMVFMGLLTLAVCGLCASMVALIVSMAAGRAKRNGNSN